MKRFIMGSLLVLFFLSILTSCASLLGENSKTLAIKSDPANATAIIYDSNNNRVAEKLTPTEIILKKAGKYTIEIEKEEYSPVKKVVPVKKQFNHAFWLNFLISGVGLGYSLALDPIFTTDPLNAYALAGYGLGAVGIIGIFYDIAKGSLTSVSPKEVNFNLNMTQAALAIKEAQEKEKQRIAAEKAENERLSAEAKRNDEEAKRKAEEEANRYDASKFTVVPTNFKPSRYAPADLFEAVAASKKLQISLNKQEAVANEFASAFMLGLGGSYIENFVSEAVFVYQDGTVIEFTSDDKAISQYMTIDTRSGLQPGQKVRVYYTITRSPLITWDVIAIERR
ncbi:putative lipoprotein [Treponema primitia ZAS-2]|uniref:Putative lipoprotein n=1 Tax=Treponema primitia (strain ATCC BAA-887 / DSM 12427 / ZAS-2) TaxID=545694 RepID=F5YK65_TREPZ|nr:PEGA domain-containing protein [Treponema primitia]AEF83936.1 putative lipoprotein [Treponema primitia ZAS-2]